MARASRASLPVLGQKAPGKEQEQEQKERGICRRADEEEGGARVMRVHLPNGNVHKTRANEEEQEEEEGGGEAEAEAEAEVELEELRRKDRGVDMESRLLKSNGSLQNFSV